MISLVIATFSIHSAVATEPYFNVGSGPLFMTPSIGFGCRFDDLGGKMDVNFTYTHSSLFRVARIAASKLLYGPGGVYVGTGYALSFHKVIMSGRGSESLLGIIFGKDFGDSFMQVEVYRPIYWKHYKLDDTQAAVKFGVKF